MREPVLNMLMIQTHAVAVVFLYNNKNVWCPIGDVRVSHPGTGIVNLLLATRICIAQKYPGPWGGGGGIQIREIVQCNMFLRIFMLYYQTPVKWGLTVAYYTHRAQVG